jgi:hypothetical protein
MAAKRPATSLLTRRGFVGVALGSVVALTLASCSKQEFRRYKMIVVVETPDGDRSGSAVRELKMNIPPNIPMLGEARGRTYVRGEAIIVDLPNGRTLFALLTGANGDVDYANTILTRAGLWDGSASDGPEELWPQAPATQGLKNTSPLPMLVTFRDIKDPTSVERVNPDDLVASFGKGYKLKTITVQVTDAPVTTGIQKRLAWLSVHPESSLDPKHSPTDYSPAATIKHGAFRQGTKK